MAVNRFVTLTNCSSAHRKPNDGTVAYRIEGDRAYGRWTLTGNHKVQAEDLLRSDS